MKRILSVDDNPDNLYMLESLFQSAGYQVDSARDGKQALERAKIQKPDLVIADILMPVMDGYSLCKEMKGNPDFRKIPFLFYTATYTEPQDRDFALSLGADEFLLKPQEPEALLAAIASHFALPELATGQEGGANALLPDLEAPAEPDPYYSQYSEVLFRKLEKKMRDLESANESLHAEIIKRQSAEEESHKLEAQLWQSKRMEDLGQLAGSLAHDFNNIITGIIGFCELAEASSENRESWPEYFREIQKAGERAAELSHSLLTFARKQPPRLSSRDLNHILADFRIFIERVIGDSVELQFELSPEPLLVLADKGQLEQVVMNLAGNARDAMVAGGVLRMKTYRSATGLTSGASAVLEVLDEGQGMDSQTLEHIFEPFFTTKAEGKGTGLGLSVIYGIVSEHQGRVEVESHVNKGSTFRVFLPLLS